MKLAETEPAAGHSAQAAVADALGQIIQRLQAGQRCDIDDLLAEFPDCAEELRSILPTMLVLNDLGCELDSAASPCATGSASASTPTAGVLGDFRILRELGRGGMGIVYEAEQISLNRRVALKVLPFAAMLDPRHLQRFKNEALAAAHLAHPNIVDVYGVGCERSIHFYAMRLIEGQTLAAVIEALKAEGQSPKDETRGRVSPRRDSESRRDSPCATGSASASAITNDKPIADRPQPTAADPLRPSSLVLNTSADAVRAPAAPLRPSSLVLRTSAMETSPIAALSTLRTTRPRDYFRRIAELGIQAAAALDHAHQMGIVHRDIKPSNLILECSHLAPRDGASRNSALRTEPARRGGNSELAAHSALRTPHSELTPKLWVTDFGLARFQNDASMTMTGDLIGTLRYMSPEQALAKRVIVDHRTDIYSLGVTLYELLTHRLAFDGADRQELLKQIAFEEPLSPRKHNPAIPLDLETIVLKAIAKNPDERYATAQDFADDLRRFGSDTPIRAKPPSRLQRTLKWIRRHKAGTVTGLSAVLLVAGILGVEGWRRVEAQRHIEQQIGNSMTAALTLIDSDRLEQAAERTAAAEEMLRNGANDAGELLTELESLSAEIAAKREDRKRFDEFIKLADEAQDKMSYGNDLGGDSIAEKALALYGVLTDDDWQVRLNESHLSAAQRETVRQTAYVTLVSLADFAVRWKKAEEGYVVQTPMVERSQKLLERAVSFHEPTRAFFFVRRECHLAEGNSAAAAADLKRFETAEAKTAWDYFLPGHTAGWHEDLDEAIRSYEAALRIQPNHYNSLFFLACRLETIGRTAEAARLWNACIALRPNHFYAHFNRAECHRSLGRTEPAKADYEAALKVAADDNERHFCLRERAGYWLDLGEIENTHRDRQQIVTLHEEALKHSLKNSGKDHRDTLLAMKQLAYVYWQAKDVDRAIRLVDEALNRCEAQFGREDWLALELLNAKAVLHETVGKCDLALLLRRQANELQLKTLGTKHPAALMTMRNLIADYWKVGQPEAAVPVAEALLKVRLDNFPLKDTETLEAMIDSAIDVARAYKEAGQPDEGATRLRKFVPQMLDLLAKQRIKLGPHSRQFANKQAEFGRGLVEAQLYGEAEPILRECLAIRNNLQSDHWRTCNAMSLLGEALFGQRKYAEAEPLLLEGYEGLKKHEAIIIASSPVQQIHVAEAAKRLVRFYQARGQPEDVTKWQEELKNLESKR